ncbi:PIN domain-containing protein [Fervidibacillus albus]|uniref:PIN domain-containing protein n=1 Tax=Fervidibacillus albus TaxID=2980026 RepID=A0A9E8LV90_9BACI|nr:PIN domain-containing protein [Fervidibacillus albus]WAA10317.1 PIN domain-containing protein [Fervidibacillus albus]
MTIAIFLDTNIIMSDYKMSGREFTNLFKASKEYRENEVFKLFITKMNSHEIFKNYEAELNKAYRYIKSYQLIANKLFDDKYLSIDKKKWKESHLKNFRSRLLDNFDVYEPSSNDVYNRAVNRLYLKQRPFRDNKEEFKDAIIWETIYDYAINHPDEKIYFISKNKKEFTSQDGNDKYRLHPDFDDLHGRIKYFITLTDLLTEMNYLKIYHFEFREQEEILSVILRYLEDYRDFDWSISSAMFDFFENRIIDSYYFQGWVTSYYIYRINGLKLDENKNVLEQEENFIIPIFFFAEIAYGIEEKNPVHERGEENENIQSQLMTSEEFIFRCKVVFNAKNNKVEEIIDAELLNPSFK